MARQSGLTEEKLEGLCDLDGGNFSERERAGLQFVQEFTVDFDGARPFLEALAPYFTRAEIAEITIFAAWQANGLRTIHSWDAHEFLNSPDVPLPYADGPSLFVRDDNSMAGSVAAEHLQNDLPSFPPFDREPLPDAESIWNAWEKLGTPPRAWLEFLSASPRALWGWAEFHQLTYEEGVLRRSFKAKVLARLADLVDVPSWLQVERNAQAPEVDDRLHIALRYAEDLFDDYLGVGDEDYRTLHKHFREAEVMELGNFIGMQIGSLKLARVIGIH